MDVVIKQTGCSLEEATNLLNECDGDTLLSILKYWKIQKEEKNEEKNEEKDKYTQIRKFMDNADINRKNINE
jgi:N-acetylmuramic acid 6-phosphate (MurNAc-6-P) etherase